MLRLETGMHTALIRRIAVDAAQRTLVTGSEDKTVRVWELASGRLLHTLRPPIGAGDEGKIYAVALSPDGRTVAAAGWTGATGESQSIYLFDRASSRLRQRLTGLPEVIYHLAYARDGAFLVATLGRTHGIRVYRHRDGAEVARDTEYGDASYGADFDPSGRLVTTSYDGFVRLYDRDFHLRVKRQAPGGQRPYAVAFSPDGRRVAVGFDDATRVAVLSGQDLTLLYTPDTTGVDNGDLGRVTWSGDGQWLYAAGNYEVRGSNTMLIRRWATGGQGPATNLSTAAQNTLLHLVPLAGGGVVFGAGDPAWGVLDAAGHPQRFQGPAIADVRANQEGFLLAPDSTAVQFGYEYGGNAPARFTVHDRVLTLDPAPDRALVAPVTTAPGLEIRGWEDTTTPSLNGTALTLQPYERSRSLAIAPDGQRFLLGTAFFLRLFDRLGAAQWQVPVPGEAWSVNIAGNGQVAVAAFGDGTLRWYRLRDGQELLAFFPHPDRKRWVLWTPAGYYDAAPGAEALIGWHVNRGRAQEADFFPVGQFHTTFYRPDVVARVLDTFDEAEALRLANAEANRRQEAVALQQRLPPVVQILAPQDSATVSTAQLTVRFSLRAPSGEPVTAIKGLVDGRPVTQTRGLQAVAATTEDATHELQLTIPMHDCEIAIIAENRYAASVPATIRLRWQGAPAPDDFVVKPKLYVLAVGVSRYQNASLTLDFAAKDAQDFTAALRHQHGKLYRDVEVRLLTDAEAHREAILDGLEWLQRQTTSKDVAAIFVAGHGTNDPNGYYYFLPANIDLERLKSTGVAFTELKNTVAALTGKVLFFLDTCHAGNVMREKRRAVLDIAGVINELASADNGAVVFAASTGNQYSLENSAWGNGAFTKALVEGLQGQADYRHSGRITVNMLDLYLSERVKALTQGRQTPTTTKPPSTPDFPVALVP
jgi:WD40 repeat protein